MEFLNWDTNMLIVTFVVNNIVLLQLIRYTVKYVCKKTPWAFDDDLASFVTGAIDIVRNREGATGAPAVKPNIDESERNDENKHRA
jgi:hypothetical protein